MDKGYTFNDVMNQFANNNMLGDVAMGVRKLSYEAFKCLHVPQIDEWIAYLKRRYLFLMCTI